MQLSDLTKLAWPAIFTLVMGAGFIQADSRWLQKTSFEAYLEAQTVRDINRDIRAIDQEIMDIDLRLHYETLTPETRAILEASKAQLEAQRADLERGLGDD